MVMSRLFLKSAKLFVFSVGLLLSLMLGGCDSGNSPTSISHHPPESTSKKEARLKQQSADFAQEGFRDLAMGHYRDAVTQFRQAILRDPAEASLYNNLGRAWYYLGEYEEAMKAYGVAQRLQPNNATLKANIGDVYRQRQKYLEAIQYYHDALQIEPTLVRVHYELGNLYLKQGKYSFAEPRFKKVLRLDPKYHRARLGLIIVYHLTHRDRSAWQEILKLESFGYEVKQSLRLAVMKGLRKEGRQDRYRPGM